MSKTSETINKMIDELDKMQKEINYYSDWTDELTLEQLDLKREIKEFKFIIDMLEQGISYSDCKKVVEIKNHKSNNKI